jgi:DNA-binding NtrC family response regulator
MRMLVADDDEAVLLALELLLRRERIAFACARSPREVLAAMAQADGAFDAVLLDLNYERDTTSGKEGFSLLDELRRTYPLVPVVVMTGWASIEGAVQAIRRGAVDYVPKPWDNTRLVALLRGLVAPPPVRVSSSAPGAPSVGPGLVSEAMRRVLATIEQVAFSDVSVLVTGEHGTGKEIVARLIHEKSGRRGAFVAVNAGALPDGTFESELFGHVRGAFTDAKTSREGAFSRAREGTLFLDEIANMPLAQQAKLLRVLQERAFQPLGATAAEPSTARIVSATNVDVAALAADGRFRPDLMYRLNTIHLDLPPLRARREEIAGLVERFVRREAERYGLPVPVLDDGVLSRLESHEWPGNVRELEHAIQRGVLLSAGNGRVTIEHLGLRDAAASVPPPASGAAGGTIKDAERAAVLQALARFPGDRLAAAKSLGLSRSAFYRRLTQLGIRPPR